ncbi:hypothetical protein ABPG74_015159 [Tetrahymena malaccensis]
MSQTDSEYLNNQMINNQNSSYFNQKKQINESNLGNNPNYHSQLQKNIKKDKHKNQNYQDMQSRRYQKHKFHEKLTKSVQDQNKPYNIKMNNSIDYFQNEQFNIQNDNQDTKKTIAYQKLNNYKQFPDEQECFIIEDYEEQGQQNVDRQKGLSFLQNQSSNEVNFSRISNKIQTVNENKQLAKLWQKQQDEQSNQEDLYQNKFIGINESKFKTRSGKFMNKVFFKDDRKLSKDVLILEEYCPNQNNNTKSILDDISSKIQLDNPQLYEDQQQSTDIQEENQKDFNQPNQQSVRDIETTKSYNGKFKMNQRDEKYKNNYQKHEKKHKAQQYNNMVKETNIKDNYQQSQITRENKSTKDNYQTNQIKSTTDSLNEQLNLPFNQNSLENIKEEQQNQIQENSSFIQNQINFIQNNIFTPEKDKQIKDEFEDKRTVIQIDDNSNQVLSFIPLPALNEIIHITINDDEDEDENQNTTNTKIQNSFNQQQCINNNHQNQTNQDNDEINYNNMQIFQSQNQKGNNSILEDNLQQINHEQLISQQQTSINQTIQEHYINQYNQIFLTQSNSFNINEYIAYQKNINTNENNIYTPIGDQQNNSIDSQIKQNNLLIQQKLAQLQLQQTILAQQQQQQLMLQQQIQQQQLLQQQYLPQTQQLHPEPQQQHQSSQQKVQQQKKINCKESKKKINTFFNQKQHNLKNIDSLTEEELIQEYESIFNN